MGGKGKREKRREKRTIDAELTFDVGEQQLGHGTADLVIQGADHDGERVQ